MPSTVVHAAFAVVLAAGLLGDAYGRRALDVIVVVMILPELDTVAGLAMDGAHRALFHNMLIPVVAGAFLYYDTRVRDRSWLRDRAGDWGLRVAWVALFTHVFAHLLLDYAHLEGINVFYPLYDRFFRLDGELYLSTTQGLVQTFVDFQIDPDTGARQIDPGETGTTATVHVANPVEPSADSDPSAERNFPIAVHGWQLYMVVLAGFTLVARRLQGEPLEE